MKRRYISFILALIFIVGLFPAEIALANMQNPVSQLWISETSSSNRNERDNYNIVLGWSDPGRSTRDDNSSVAGPLGNGGLDLRHVTEGYNLYYRNASKGAAYTDTPFVEELTSEDLGNNLNHSFKMTLELGSFYAFKVVPYHYGDTGPNDGYTPHYARNPNSEGFRRILASVGAQNPQLEALLLTDLTVEAEGLGFGNSITVTWDNPLYNGQELIKEYTIYYTRQGDDINSPMTNADSKRVSIDNPDLLRVDGGKKLQYSFSDDALEYGVPYSVKVVPTISDKILIGDTAFPLTNSPREYRCDNVYLKPSLNVSAYSDDQIKITWDSLASFFAGRDFQVQVIALSMESDDEKVIGSLHGDQARFTNFWLEPQPGKETRYMIRIIYGDNDLEIDSHIATFVPKIADYLPYRPTIYHAKQTEPVTSPLSIDIKWLAFMREVFDPDNEKIDETYGMYIDDRITYDIWVTDDILNFDDPALEPLLTNLDASTLPLSPYIEPPFSENNPRPVYSTSIDKYMKKDNTGNYTKKDLEDNKVYYFKIVATRKEDSEGIEPRKSLEALGSCYIPASDDISLTPVMISSPPLKVTEIKTTSIAIEWDTRWIEVFDPGARKWYSQLGVKNGEPIFGDGSIENILTKISADSEDVAGYLLTTLTGAGVDENKASTIASRVMDLTDAKYKIHVVEYEGMISENISSYEQYIKDRLLDQVGTENQEGSKWLTQWTDITPKGEGRTLHHVVEELDPNTPYVIFLRPYKVNASYYPAFVAGTTLDVYPDLPVVPTAPIIEVVPEETTDMSVTVKFTYTEDPDNMENLTYTFYYSELLTDYPEGGTAIEWKELLADKKVKTETNKTTGQPETYMYYTIDNLFPETIYYFWVSATSKIADVTKISNPTSETTKELAPPEPPRGFGPASDNSLDVYNKSNETDIKSVAPEYITYEWMRDPRDDGDVPASFAEGSAEALLSELLPSYYMAKFNELIPNKTYYARAKTILTVTKGDNGIERSYSYTIQISPNSNFLDAIEITIPPLEGEADSINTLRKESAWTTTLYLFTNPDYSDYDTDKNDKHYPLPTNDFEIHYDSNTKTLTYRFRSNEKDAMGNNDNQVDQRFISSLLSNPSFIYDIDLSTYGANEIKAREVVMPYSIYKAFDERKMGLNVISNAMSVTIKPGSFNTAEVNSARDFGADSNVKLVITDYVTVSALTEAESYANIPQKISLTVTTPTRTVNMTNTGTDMAISLKLNNRHLVMDSNVGGYVSDANTGGWSRLNGQFDRMTGTFDVSSRKLANYAAITKSSPVLFNSDNSVTNNVINVTTKLDIRDLPSLDPSDPIHANQFNHLVLAVSKNQLSVSINGTMNDEDRSALGKAGILVSGSSVSREAGITAMIRLYEIKTRPVKSYPSANESYFPDMSTVSPMHMTPMLKAEEIGMLDRFGYTIDPKRDMTFADVFYMLDIIIADAGL